MARLPRLLLAGYPLHVMVRGNNRQAVFGHDDDRQQYLSWLRDAAREYEVAVHAYVLMDNHVHLLVTPTTVAGLSRMMQSMGRRYTQYFNQQYLRTGTLWEGRFKSCLIEADNYLLACARYIELNPVRAGLVMQPEDYLWSSYAHHAGLVVQSWLTDHPLYWGLGNTPFERQSAWRNLLAEGMADKEVQMLTAGVQKGWALGQETFLIQLAEQGARRPSALPKGRPVGSGKKR